QVPELYVPYVDDGLRGQLADRLAVSNMRRGHAVGGDEPAIGKLAAAYARPVDRAYVYLLQPGDAATSEAARPPPASSGEVGRAVAAYIGLVRAGYEAERGRLADAVRAGGLAGRFTPEELSRMRDVPPRSDRLPLRGLLPPMTPVVVWAPWMNDVL